MLKIERIYTKPFDQSGFRILVDCKWARGISKQTAVLDEWAKQIAPSTKLREWFQHIDAKFPEFAVKYTQELNDNPSTPQFIQLVAKQLKTGPVIFLCGAKNTTHNNAVVLKAYVIKQLGIEQPADSSFTALLYNDGVTNRSKSMPAAIQWLNEHPATLQKLPIHIKAPHLYMADKATSMDHQALLTTAIKNHI